MATFYSIWNLHLLFLALTLLSSKLLFLAQNYLVKKLCGKNCQLYKFVKACKSTIANIKGNQASICSIKKEGQQDETY